MLRFRGFKATFSTSKTKSSNLVHYDYTPGVSLTGAYRANKDELFGPVNYLNPPKKITPDMVTLPGARSGGRKEISKSTSNLAQPLTNNSTNPLTSNSAQPLTSNSAQPLQETVNLTKSTPNIPQDVPKPLTRTQIKEQQKVEKKRLEEQKKLAAKEKEKAEKLRKEREKQEERRKAEEKKKSIAEKKKTIEEQKKSIAEQKKSTAEEKKSKSKAPQPQPQADNVQIPEISTQIDRPQSTNTLDSSISKSSGPPPYTPQENIINNKSDNSGNTSFAIDDSTSWNMISQHRQEINRPLVVKSLPKQTHLDLQYNVDTNTTSNSDA